MNPVALNFQRITGANYTSYPEVISWSNKKPSSELWSGLLKKSYSTEKGLVLYIHLPFCESLCTFCSFGPIITRNHNAEEKYIQHLMDELKHQIEIIGEKPLIHEIYLGGGTPHFFSSDNLLSLFRQIASFTRFDSAIHIRTEANPYTVTLEKLNTLRKCGVNEIRFGIQDFDDKVQQANGKKMNEADFKELFRNVRSIGFESITAEIIVGLPFQTRKSLMKTIYALRDMKPDQIILHEFVPGEIKSPHHKKLLESTPVPVEQDALKAMAHDLITQSGFHHIGMDHFVQKADYAWRRMKNNGLSYHNYGYSFHPCKITLGIGVGAISDLWLASAQNFRTLQEWEEYTLLKKEKLRLVKYSKSELNSRNRIHDIQTKHVTTWTEEDEKNKKFKSAIDKLQLMASKSFLEIKNRRISLHFEGKMQMRLICSILDSRNFGAKSLKTRSHTCYGTAG